MVERRGRTPRPKEEIVWKEVESFEFLADGITLSGPSGVGKSTIAMEVASDLGLHFIEPSRGFRKKAGKKGHDVIGYAERPPRVDKSFDNRVADIIRNAKSRKKKPLVVARLAGWVAKKTIREMKRRNKVATHEVDVPNIITVRFNAPDKTRFPRIQRRENERVDDKNTRRELINVFNARADLPFIPYEEHFSLQGIADLTIGRETGDLVNSWWIAHPDMYPINPQSDDYDERGERLYDIEIDASGSREEVKSQFYQELERVGAIRRVVRLEPARIPRTS